MTAKTWILIAAAAALVAGAYLLLASPSNTVSVYNPDPPGPEFTIVILHSSPGLDFARVGCLRPGRRATAVGRDAAGAYLLLDDPHGWVAAHLVQVRGDVDALPISSETIAVVPPVPGSPVTVTNPKSAKDNFTARVLAEPKPFAEEVGKLSPGSSARAIGRDAPGVWLYLDRPRGWTLAVVLDVSGDVNALPVHDLGVPAASADPQP